MNIHIGNNKEKEAPNLRESKGVVWEELERRKGRGKLCLYIIISKIKKVYTRDTCLSQSIRLFIQ